MEDQSTKIQQNVYKWPFTLHQDISNELETTEKNKMTEFLTFQEIVDTLLPHLDISWIRRFELQDQDVGIGVHGSISHTFECKLEPSQFTVTAGDSLSHHPTTFLPIPFLFNFSNHSTRFHFISFLIFFFIRSVSVSRCSQWNMANQFTSIATIKKRRSIDRLTRVIAEETVLLSPFGSAIFQRVEEDKHQQGKETGQEGVQYDVEQQNLGCKIERKKKQQINRSYRSEQTNEKMLEAEKEEKDRKKERKRGRKERKRNRRRRKGTAPKKREKSSARIGGALLYLIDVAMTIHD